MSKKNIASAVWHGTLKNGKGTGKLHSIDKEFAYSFKSRFEEGPGTNPEELIAAAHAQCFSMAFSQILEKEGFDPEEINTTAHVSLEKKDGGFALTSSHLETKAKVADISEDKLKEIAEEAKNNCPVSGALSALKLSVNAVLKQ
jgi:osmotically inducible protein OsmC